MPGELDTIMRGVIAENIDLLAGGIGQIADGQTVGETSADENWLLIAQDDPTENGPQRVTPAGEWDRITEMSVSADFLYGTRILVQFGTRYHDSVWYYSGNSNPSIGADSLYFDLRAYATPNPGLTEVEPGYYPNPLPIVDSQGVLTFDEGPAGVEYISGYELSRPETTQFVVDEGNIWIPGLNRIAKTPTVSFPVFSGTDRLAYLYASDDDDLPIRMFTGHENRPFYYADDAAHKIDDDLLRFIGVARREASVSAYHAFTFDPSTGEYTYLPPSSMSENLIEGGESVGGTGGIELTTNLGDSGTSPLYFLPTGVDSVKLFVKTPGAGLVFGHPEDGITLSTTNYLERVPGSTPLGMEINVELDSQQRFTWMREATTGAPFGQTIDLIGFTLRR